MNKKASILTLIAAAALPAAAAITGQWRLHPTFDNSVTKVVDSPTRTYFTGYPQTYNANIQQLSLPDCMLFYYDKEGDEIVAAAARHDMASTTVRLIEYNPRKEYLMVVYDNQDIDLLYDDGSVVNIGALKNAVMPTSKAVNAVSFDPDNDLAWVATDFGYVAINDERHEVAESRNYGETLQEVVHIGDDIYILHEGQWHKAPYKASRMKFTDYNEVTGLLPDTRFYHMSPTRVLVCEPHEDHSYTISICDVKNGVLEEIRNTTANYVSTVRPSKRGFMLTSYSAFVEAITSTGYFEYAERPQDDKGNNLSACWDFQESYNVAPRKGVKAYSRGADKKYAVSKDYMLPNAPNAYISREMIYHPQYGTLVSTYGTDNMMSSTSYSMPNLLSGLKDGLWTPYSTEYRNTQQANVGQTPRGFAIDPDDNKYIYQGSSFSGLTRLNLEDPSDILHFTHPADATASKPGFVKMFDTSTGWKRIASVTDPAFDADNVLWAYFFDYDNKDRLTFRFWNRADRRATTDAASAREWKTLTKTLADFPKISAKFLPLKTSVNKNLIFFMSSGGLFVLDHNGTPENGADDKITTFTKVTDQDGNTVRLTSPNQLWEDPQTGVVWISSAEGLLYCTPRNLLQGQGVLNKVKVSRNDGTSLADYLLNGVEIAGIAHDSEGRKWIASVGAGVVVTSSDGKTVYQEFTAENSELPSNNLYSIVYNPSAGSMLMSTDKGLCEFFIGGSTQGVSDTDAVRAYPNPVAPDYYGWITIDGLPDNSLVKIVDVKGNLVRELGRASGGSVQWDANNLHYDRVKTGVYYILASPGSDGGGETRVGKIMVMN